MNKSDVLLSILLLTVIVISILNVPLDTTDPTYIFQGTYTSGIDGISVVFTFDANTISDVIFPSCPNFIMVNDSSSAFIPGFTLEENTCRVSKMLG